MKKKRFLGRSVLVTNKVTIGQCSMVDTYLVSWLIMCQNIQFVFLSHVWLSVKLYGKHRNK